MPEKDQKKALETHEIQMWAQYLLDSARMETPADDLLEKLANLSWADLEAGLPDDDHRKAFWINLYNAFNMLMMKSDPAASQNRSGRMKHFMRKTIVVAGESLSLMNIENDLLRRGRLWWSLGYLSRPFPRSYFKHFRCDRLDPRIHFALNCGAMSCPPIRFYHPHEVEAQLELSTAGFMATEVRQKNGEPEQTLYVSSIFRLYQGDFGGRRGILNWIRRYRNDLPPGRIRLRWLSYDWTVDLDAFVE